MTESDAPYALQVKAFERLKRMMLSWNLHHLPFLQINNILTF